MNTKPVLTNPFPAATLTHFDVQFLKDYNIFLSNPDANGEMVKPRILIGVEAYETVVLLDSTPTKLPSGLLAQNTVFGPALFGKSDAIDRTSYAEHVVVACPETLSDVKQELREMYELEGMGISTDEYQKNDTAYDYMNSYAKRITFKDGEITAPLPLKDNVVELDDNFKVAASRLNALLKFHKGHPTQNKKSGMRKYSKTTKTTTSLKKSHHQNEVPVSQPHITCHDQVCGGVKNLHLSGLCSTPPQRHMENFH
ncbi:hypothetical protein Q1695_009641 [Nippostrongylus brasiliensis]|nr:hypothetical protein Q1695_009641 [Nippostrongylus brasiliensis]